MFVRVGALLAVIGAIVAIAARPSGGAGPEEIYVVKPTDTLWSIASSHYPGDPREGIWKLERRNHLRAALLTPGQKLVLP
jgi:LysM repeat protein